MSNVHLFDKKLILLLHIYIYYIYIRACINIIREGGGSQITICVRRGGAMKKRLGTTVLKSKTLVDGTWFLFHDPCHILSYSRKQVQLPVGVRHCCKLSSVT